MASLGVLPAIAIAAGVAGGLAGPWPAVSYAGLMVVCLGVGGIGWWRGWRMLTVASLLCGFAAAGAASAVHARAEALDPPLRRVLDTAFGQFTIDSQGPGGRHDPLPTRGRLLEDAAPQDGFVGARIEVLAVQIAGAWVPAGGDVAVSISGRPSRRRVASWRAGRTVEMPLQFRRPARYLDDGVPDFERDAALRGTALLASAKSGLLVQVVARGRWWDEAGAAVRHRVRQAVQRWIAPRGSTAAAIATAVLIGDRAAIPDAVRAALQAAGTYHLIAISGGNIAVFVVLASALCRGCGLGPRPAALATLVLVVAYGAVVVPSPSVFRAVLVAAIYMASRALDHRATPWHAAGVAAATMLVAQPLDLLDPGFVLTFGAAAALLASSGRIAALSWPRGTRWLAGVAVASLAIEAALLPVQASAFSQVALAGILLNLLAVPAMAMLQIAAMAVVALDVAGTAASVPAAVAAAMTHVVVESAMWASRLGVAWVVPPPAVFPVVAYYVLLLGAAAGPLRARTAAAVGCGAIAVTILTGSTWPWIHSPPRALGTARLTMFDVGQGEAMLLEPGNAGAVLIDTGGAPFGSRFDVGRRVLMPALWARGVAALSALAITHGDPDHLGGATSALAALRVQEAWLGVPVPGHPPGDALLAGLAARRAAVRPLRAGGVLDIGRARIRVLHPPEPDWERRRVRNDDSLVLEVTIGDVALLLTGDVSAEVERQIAPRLTRAHVRVLKVAHHGSRTSSGRELLEWWRPQLAIVSAGRGNAFGHPTREALDRLEAVGARVLRTDHDGQITLTTDGRAVTWQTFEGGYGVIDGG